MSNSSLMFPTFNVSLEKDRIILLVTWDPLSGSISYRILDPSHQGGPKLIYFHSPEKFPEDKLDSLLDEIQKALRIASDSLEEGQESEACIRLLEDFSASLTAKIIPEKLIKYLSSRIDLSLIQISSNEYWIPWDLLYCIEKKSFWGYLWSSVRLPVPPVDDRRQPLPPNPQYQLFNIINCIGPSISGDWIYLRKAIEIFDWLRVEPTINVFVNDPNQNDYLTYQDICSISKDNRIDIANFICHCKNDELRSSYLHIGPDLDHAITYVRCKDISFLDTIIIVSACSFAKPFRHLGQMLSFAWELSLSGAGAFVGPVADITCQTAIEFAGQFIHYVVDSNDTVSRAILRARIKLRKNGDFRGLYFSLYGYPDARKIPHFDTG